MSSFLTAINPQITKTWAAGDRQGCFSLVFKAVKFSYLGVLVLLMPLLFEAETVLGLWLTVVPAHSAAFVRLALVALLVDMFGNPLLTLMLATGKVKKYYIVTGLVSYLCLPLVWLAFRLGASVEWSYVGFIVVYTVVLALKFLFVRDSSSCPEVFPGSRIPVAGADSDVGIVAGVGLYVSSSGVCASDTGVRTVLGGYIGPGLHNGVYPRRKGFCHPKNRPQPGTVEVGFGG